MQANLHIPAVTKGKIQLSAIEVTETRTIANVRIHVERVIGTVSRNIQFFKVPNLSTMSWKEMEKSAQLLIGLCVCCGLCNVCNSVWYNTMYYHFTMYVKITRMIVKIFSLLITLDLHTLLQYHFPQGIVSIIRQVVWNHSIVHSSLSHPNILPYFSPPPQAIYVLWIAAPSIV
jgi:hypothetical protein